jgi:hypothetical protein
VVVVGWHVGTLPSKSPLTTLYRGGLSAHRPLSTYSAAKGVDSTTFLRWRQRRRSAVLGVWERLIAVQRPCLSSRSVCLSGSLFVGYPPSWIIVRSCKRSKKHLRGHGCRNTRSALPLGPSSPSPSRLFATSLLGLLRPPTSSPTDATPSNLSEPRTGASPKFVQGTNVRAETPIS